MGGSGLLIVAMVPVTLLLANLAPDGYTSFWQTEVGPLDLHHWVNEFLMTLFFFVVGLEIKHELTHGELRNRRHALTPFVAAIGGMVIPAMIYVSINAGSGVMSGWAIPMATDIAIVVGVLALLGSRVAPGLRTFLLTLAIVDDIGAIAVIAVFFAPHPVSLAWLAFAAVALVVTYVLSRNGTPHVSVLVLLATIVWIATYKSGIHATVAGVLFAIALPPNARLMHRMQPISSWIVVPVFVLANAGIEIGITQISDAITSPIALGVAAGLVIGKPAGVCLFTFLATRVLGGSLPAGTRFGVICASSILCGIGFTVSLFLAELAFTNPAEVEIAKMAVLFASLLASVIGVIVLQRCLRTVKS